jgi:hypothetical protein
MHLVLYSKPGCHLCEGLQEKLAAITNISLEVEIRDITTRDDWFQAYQYEIPVLMWQKDTDSAESPQMIPLPRLSPRAPIPQVERMLQTYLQGNKAE